MKKLATTILILALSAVAATAQNDARTWVGERSWAPGGFTLKLHDPIDAGQFRDQYLRNREVWDAVFLYLRDTRLDTLSVGERRLPGLGDRVVLRLTEGPTRPKENLQRLEYHRKYIDIHINRTGSELIAWARPAESETTTVTEYDAGRDVGFCTTSVPVNYHRSTTDGMFILFPSDYHLPSIHDGESGSVKKLVIKIEYLQ